MKFIIIAIIVALAVFFFNRSANNKKLALENTQIGQDFLTANSQKEGIFVSSSGLQYEILQKGTGNTQPNATSTVKVHYHGTLMDGTVFDSSVERGEAISFPLNQVIKGWTEGVQLMSEGDKYRFFIPATLAYGNQAAGSIKPGSLLIFEVELLEIL